MKKYKLNMSFFELTKNQEQYFIKIPGFKTRKTLNEIVNSEQFNKIKDSELLCIFIYSKLDKSILKRFKNLKYIITRSKGLDHIDLGYCNANNIKVFNINYKPNSIAEYTFALLLYYLRKPNRPKYQGNELYKKTLGIIGFGAIGQEIAKIAKAFGMKVVYYDKYIKNKKAYLDLDNLLSSSNIISINLPLTKETKNLINIDRIKQVKNDAIIINTARSEIISDEAIKFSLENMNNIFILDVYTDYVKKISKEYKHRFILTSHNAYNTQEAEERISYETLKIINKLNN